MLFYITLLSVHQTLPSLRVRGTDTELLDDPLLIQDLQQNLEFDITGSSRKEGKGRHQLWDMTRNNF